jgi:hypothetical protein
MRTTLTLEPDIFSVARQMAQAHGESIGNVISKLARAGLHALNQPLIQPRAKAQFPVFAVPADAAIFGAEAVLLDADEV